MVSCRRAIFFLPGLSRITQNSFNAVFVPRRRRAVEAANADDAAHVIVLAGAGRAFCAGYDLKAFAEAKTPLI